MSVHFVFATARKDLRRRLADPTALLIWFALPVAIGGLLILISSGNGGAPHGRLLVADEDRSFVSRLIGGVLRQGELADLFDVVSEERDEGRRLIDAGEATALLILPAGLQDAFVGKGVAEVQLVTNPTHRILPSVIEETLEIAVDSAFYFERLLRESARRIPDLPADDDLTAISLSDDAIVVLLEGVDTRLREVGNITLVPPVLNVEFAAAPDGSDASSAPGVFDVGKVFLPGMIFLSVLFVAQGLSGDVWNEKRLGTLRRAASSPPSMAAFLAGKLLAGGLIAGIAALAGVAAGLLLFELPLRQAPLAVFWIAFTGSVMFVYFVLLQLFASSQRAGDMLSNIVLFPIMMLGGSFFPLEMMPEWMAAIGRWTPNGAALIRLQDILAARPDFGELFISALLIGIPAMVGFALAVRRMRGRFLVS